jgi:hypothetical protein
MVKGGSATELVAMVLRAEFGWDPKGLGLDGMMTELKE